MAVINMISCLCICAWATWGVCSSRVRGGLLCRSLFGVVALSAMGVIFAPHGVYTAGRTAEVTLNVSLAMLCIRHIMLKNRATFGRLKRLIIGRLK